MRGNKVQLGPNKWRLRVYAGRDPLTGKERSHSKQFVGGEKAADTELARFVTEVVDGRVGGTTATVGSLLDRFIDHSERIGRSPSTIHEYRRMAKILAGGPIGALSLRKLTPDHLDALYHRMAEKGSGAAGARGSLSAASINRYHDMMKAALAWAVKRGWLDRSPADRASPPRERRAELRAPTPEEVRALIAAAIARDPAKGVLLFMAAVAGARRGELCALRRSDLDLERGILTIRHAVKKSGPRSFTIGGTKTHQVRSLSLAPEVSTLLTEYLATVDREVKAGGFTIAEDPFLFSPAADYSRPYDPDTVTQFTSRLMRELGTPYHLHQLRHFAATQMIGAGYDPVTVAGRLGHADSSVTLNVYSHALEQRDRAAGDHLGQLVGPISLAPREEEDDGGEKPT